MIIIPEQHYTQDNKSDKTGNVYFSKNIKYDAFGYMTLASRAFKMYGEDIDSNFGAVLGIEFLSDTSGKIITSDEVWDFSVDSSTLSFSIDVPAPSVTFDSRSESWQGRLYVSTNTGLFYFDGAVWTNTGIAALQPSVTHPLSLFRNRNELAIGNSNQVRLIDTAHATTQNLVLPADMEVTHVEYNNNRIGILTKTDGNSVVEDDEAYFFVWDGNTAEANTGVPVGTIFPDTLCAYKSSWVVLNREGQLLYYTGTSFQLLAAFPHFYRDFINGDTTANVLSRGPNMIVDGDNIFINFSVDLDYQEQFNSSYIEPLAEGVWCYDPSVGLYHRYAPSISRMRLSTILAVNTGTDTITINNNFVPDTGTQILYSQDNTTEPLKEGTIYYVIKVAVNQLKLATTKANALAGTAIDITSGGFVSGYFYMPTITDYGQLIISTSGEAYALRKVPAQRLTQDFMVFGAELNIGTGGSSIDNYCQTVPKFKNIGYWLSPRIYSQEVKAAEKRVIVKHNTLLEQDRIIVKYKVRDYGVLPQSTQNVSFGELTWTSTTTATTDSDLTNVKALVDAGIEIECELIAAVGAGQMSRVTSISLAGTTFTVTLEDALEGITVGEESLAKFDSWKVAKIQTNTDTTNEEGYFEALISEPSTWLQLKIVLEGYQTTIQQINIVTETSQGSS